MCDSAVVQVCSNGTRVYVHRSIFEEVLAKCVQRANAIRIGDPFNDTMKMGAMISTAHAEKVMGYIDRARAEVCSTHSGVLLFNFAVVITSSNILPNVVCLVLWP